MLKGQIVDMGREVLPHLKALQEVIKQHADAGDFDKGEIASIAISADNYVSFRLPSWGTCEVGRLIEDDGYSVKDYGLGGYGELWKEEQS